MSDAPLEHKAPYRTANDWFNRVIVLLIALMGLVLGVPLALWGFLRLCGVLRRSLTLSGALWDLWDLWGSPELA